MEFNNTLCHDSEVRGLHTFSQRGHAAGEALVQLQNCTPVAFISPERYSAIFITGTPVVYHISLALLMQVVLCLCLLVNHLA